ncbi:MAG TPA: cupredoxin domain-containing protein [Rhizomicrobium sp.]|jgi:plastocyanin
MATRHLMVAFCALLSSAPAFAQSAPDWSMAKRVDVSLSNYAFSPSELRLQRGVPYVLHFTNTAAKSHDFSAPAFFSASTIAADDRAKVVKGAVELDENASADVKLIPNTSGAYELRCTHFMHAMLGMTGKVVVD